MYVEVSIIAEVKYTKVQVSIIVDTIVILNNEREYLNPITSLFASS